MRWKGRVAYDGTDFYGWQSQAGGNTIQDYLERRLAVVFRQPVRVHGSGRTDAGVHAREQVFHFDFDWSHPKRDLLRALRTGLPAGILVYSMEKAEADFHARHSATGKRYVYRCFEGWALPFEARFVHSLQNRRLDTTVMQQAAASLIGEHNFKAFGANRRDDSTEDPHKHLWKLDVRRAGPLVTITAEGSSFLYKMARSLAGCLINVGTGKISPHEPRRILESFERTPNVTTAPALGLTLEKVFYGPHEAREEADDAG